MRVRPSVAVLPVSVRLSTHSHHSDATGPGTVTPSSPNPSPVVLFFILCVLCLTGWEVQNHVPPGTIMKALIRGGDSGPWMRFMKGEMTTERFLEEFGRLCSEIVSDEHSLLISSLSLFSGEGC